MALGCTTKKVVESSKEAGYVEWQTASSLSPVLDVATKRDQLVFVDVYTDWCLPCKLMDQDVFGDKPTGEYLSDNFTCYKVNAEKENGPDLTFLFEVKVYPTLLWLDHKGRVVLRKEGAAYHAELKRLSEEAIQTYKSGT